MPFVRMYFLNVAIIAPMHTNHPKSVRREILLLLYERYMNEPLESVPPTDFVESGRVAREDLLANMYYLDDRGLVELLRGFNPPWFAGARLKPDGIDLVENRFEFDLRFPPASGMGDEAGATVPVLMERLVDEAEFSPLDGEERKSLLRDIQYLREEIARPSVRWRREVVLGVLEWIAVPFEDVDEHLPSLGELRKALREELGDG